MKVQRYLVVDLETGLVLDDLGDLAEALEELEERKTDFYGEGWDLVSRPDYGVIDGLRMELYDQDRGEIVRCWYDGFTGTWRRRLEVTA